MIYDRFRRGRYHPAFVWGGIFIIVMQPLKILIAKTELWRAAALWLTR